MYVWTSSQERVEQTFWASGQPDDYHNVEYCVEILSPSGVWVDVPCGTNPRPSVCEMKLVAWVLQL